jgi:hypothetical protein
MLHPSWNYATPSIHTFVTRNSILEPMTAHALFSGPTCSHHAAQLKKLGPRKFHDVARIKCLLGTLPFFARIVFKVFICRKSN